MVDTLTFAQAAGAANAYRIERDELRHQLDAANALLRDALSSLSWIEQQAESAMSISAGCATTHGDGGGGLEMVNSTASDIAINASMLSAKISTHLAPNQDA